MEDQSVSSAPPKRPVPAGPPIPNLYNSTMGGTVKGI
ncbi:hypothetical protein KIPB_014874, partial [Kipferlia bialata]|eukprot:g14874.t1